MSRKGFTLLELAFVLAIISFLLAGTIPAYHLFWLHTQTTEARTLLPAIAHAESTWRRDHGNYLECLPSEGEAIPRAARPFPGRPCWKALGITTSQQSRYRYTVKLTPTGFEAVAEGDLDADGDTSLFRIRSHEGGLSSDEELE